MLLEVCLSGTHSKFHTSYSQIMIVFFVPLSENRPCRKRDLFDLFPLFEDFKWQHESL